MSEALTSPTPAVRVDRTLPRQCAVLAGLLVVGAWVHATYDPARITVYNASAANGPLVYAALAVVWLGFVANAAVGARGGHLLPLVVSLAVGGLVVPPRYLAPILLAAATLFAILRCPLPRWLRVTAYLGTIVLLYGVHGRYGDVPLWYPLTGLFSIPPLLYLYETEIRAGRDGHRHDVVEFLSYVFLFPLWFVPIPPVFDFEKWRDGRNKRPLDEVAGDGLRMATIAIAKLWLVGVVAPLLPAAPVGSTFLPAVYGWMLMSFVLLFTVVSGVYELCVAGVMLFGYDLPRPFDRTLLSCGLLDFFRRWNVYWKDLVVKLAFLPIVVRYRKSNRTFVLVAAGITTIGVSFLLDWWQVSWVGDAAIPAGRVVSWLIFGTVVTLELVVEHHRQGRRLGPIARCVGIAVTLLAASVLFALPFTPKPLALLQSLVGAAPFPATRFPL